MISALNRLANGTIELTITIPWSRVKTAYDQAMDEVVKKAEIKGFRKGKAPKKMVEGKVDKTALSQEVLKDLLPQVYLEAVKEHNLKPILNPQVTIISLKENQDWQFQAKTCEMPAVELGDYQGEARKALAAEKIWVPGKGDPTKKPKKTDEDEKLAKVFQTLLQTAKIDLPELLVQEEVNKMLSRLIDQTGRLGMTVEQYLASTGKTIDQLKAEFRGQASESLRLELILGAIADKEQVKADEAEVKKMIEAVPDEKARKDLQSPAQQAYIRQLLRKRQVIDKLTKL